MRQRSMGHYIYRCQTTAHSHSQHMVLFTYNQSNMSDFTTECEESSSDFITECADSSDEWLPHKGSSETSDSSYDSKRTQCTKSKPLAKILPPVVASTTRQSRGRTRARGRAAASSSRGTVRVRSHVIHSRSTSSSTSSSSSTSTTSSTSSSTVCSPAYFRKSRASSPKPRGATKRQRSTSTTQSEEGVSRQAKARKLWKRGVKSTTSPCLLCPEHRAYTNLKKHIRDIHGLDRPDARSNRPPRGKWGRRYTRRICPLCGGVYQRLRDHLRSTEGRGHSVPKNKVAKLIRKARVTKYIPTPYTSLESGDLSVCLPPQATSQPPTPGESEPTMPPVDRAPTNFRQCPTLLRFFRWLGPEAGKAKAARRACAEQVRYIWSLVDPTGKDMRRPRPKFQTLLDENQIRRKWLTKCKLAPGTKLAYGSALVKFTEFIEQQKFRVPSKAPALLRQAWFRWRRHIVKEGLRRRTRFQAELQSVLVRPEEFRAVFNHPSIRELEEKLVDFNIDRVKNPMKLFHRAQNCLILRLAASNGQRNSAVRQMTVREVESAVSGDRGVVITVASHKRDVDGPARLCLHNRYYAQLRGFLLLREHVLQGQDCRKRKDFPVFLSLGDPPHGLSHSKVHRAINQCWRLGGQDRDISLTLIRKSTTTRVRAAHPELREALAHHMNHAARTADVYYSIQDDANAFRTMEAITNVMEIDTRPSPVSAETPMDLTAQEATTAGGSTAVEPEQRDEIEQAGAAVEETEGSDSTDQTSPDSRVSSGPEIASPNQHTSPRIKGRTASPAEHTTPRRTRKGGVLSSVDPPAVSRHKRRFFTQEESATVLRLCQKIVEWGRHGGGVSQNMVMMALRQTSEGVALIDRLSPRAASLKTNLDKVLADKVRTALRAKK